MTDDATRYRWLANHVKEIYFDTKCGQGFNYGSDYETKEELDAAIDKEIKHETRIDNQES
jgi:hypothetical protein